MHSDYKWYMISTVSGKEDNVIEALKNKISSKKMEDFFKDIRIFKMPHLSNKELQKKSRGEEYIVKYVNIYKGYIFLNMIMTDESWYLVRNTQYVTGLIGSSGKGAKPTPISESTFEKMIEKERILTEKFAAGDIETAFKEGIMVKIKSGIYKDEVGEIIRNDDIEQKAFVNIEQFGRKVPTEFSHQDLEICS
ncbi:transcription termination/antitermination protein NusG [Mycoplasmopsis arginini]|uniref:Transcription termination/antitermination protein NusG n=2 Tax=Mycoplasmopsis TaxID=2767358 RepID=A0A0C6FY42_MYCAR|nr:transcription termination/antitermination protein NusG [Mycoplasmopsis arginini]ENY69572.1 Transcription antitermination protein [Mycoplasmopsis arginini 7264]MCY2903069.1 transcription termination/antitermination protein NusG [Mycoplasmopsis arginini QMP CG1-2758]MDI3348568.1 transcription termination/antitermination protein NusG [Mycoplasmopsis arginini]MDI3348626.1 transcription termination/antitermination protein NusG [Mycoplasmopsis arginini]MDI3349818.1 transcription termination/antit